MIVERGPWTTGQAQPLVLISSFTCSRGGPQVLDEVNLSAAMLLTLSHRLQHTGGAAHAAVHILTGAAADTVVPTARGDVHAQQRRTLQTGLVGMPNVGKSTLFNAMLGRAAAEASNFPFCKPFFFPLTVSL